MEFVDIHSHYIPALDDGPSNIEETIEFLRVAYETGTRTIIATPHMFLDRFQNFDPDDVRSRFEEMRRALDEVVKRSECTFLRELTLGLGAENFVSPEFIDSLTIGRVLPLNGSHYLLVEFDPMVTRDYFSKVISAIFHRDFVPVIAHVERYLLFQRDPASLAPFLDQGCITQVNAASLLRSYWSARRRTTETLLQKGLALVIASDGHGAKHRPPVLAQAYAKLRRKHTEEQVAAWMVNNPAWILRSAPVGPEKIL